MVILGSDSQTLPAECIRFLLECKADVALDGGYYGISCRKIVPHMFDAVRPSTGDALQDTVQAVRRCGLSYAFGQKWFDVDTPEGLRQLTEHYT